MTRETKAVLTARAVAVFSWLGFEDPIVDDRNSKWSVTHLYVHFMGVTVQCWYDGGIDFFDNGDEDPPAIRRIEEAHPLPKVEP
jgi:hypothetical protein